MSWTQEPGFKHSQSCFNFTQQQIALANSELVQHQGSLELLIVDACFPDHYQQGRRVLVTNNWIANGQLDTARYEQFPASWYGLYAGTVQVDPVTPIKKFNCFINRMDPIRQSWLYQLIRRGVFDQGLISFNMDISRHILNGQCQVTDTPHAVFEQQFQQYLQLFQPEHELARGLVPYRNFDGDLNQVIMQTEFSIVLETYFDRNQVITFSEKIFRCLKLPRPWVMFAMQNAVAYLRDLGFDVLDNLVDHSYDAVESDIKRQSAVLDQIEFMCKQTLTQAQIQRCQQAADHNQQLLFKMFNCFHNDVNITCKNAVDKCYQL
jgi:hypothetical protein